MAKPRAVKMEVLTGEARLFSLPSAPPPLLSSWEPLSSTWATKAALPRVLEALKISRSPRTVEAFTLPMAAAGHFVETYTHDYEATKNCITLSTFHYLQASHDQKLQALVVTSNDGLSDDLYNALTSVAGILGFSPKITKSFSDDAHVCIVSASELARASKSASFKLAIFVHADEMYDNSNDTLEKISSIISTSNQDRTDNCILTFLTRNPVDEAESKTFALRKFQKALFKNRPYAELEDAKDLINFLKREGIKIESEQLARAGCYDLNTLRSLDPQSRPCSSS
eukprot:467447-Hanusia_phi.AAC.1